MKIDHIVFGIADIQAGIDRMEELIGARPVLAGEHPELGTHNALIAMGGRQYLEVLAPRPGASLAREFQVLNTLSSLTPVTWAVATPDARATAELLVEHGHSTTEVTSGSRIRTDGTRLEWKTFHLSELGIEGAPFFIEWSREAPHPGDAAPAGCRLQSVELVHPSSDSLREVFALLDLDVPLTKGPSSRLRVRVEGPSGPVAI